MKLENICHHRFKNIYNNLKSFWHRKNISLPNYAQRGEFYMSMYMHTYLSTIVYKQTICQATFYGNLNISLTSNKLIKNNNFVVQVLRPCIFTFSVRQKLFIISSMLLIQLEHQGITWLYSNEHILHRDPFIWHHILYFS